MIASTLDISATTAATDVAEYPLSSYPSPLSRSAPVDDESFSCPALTVDQSLSKYVPTYSYEFADQNALSGTNPPLILLRGSHDSEVQYLFDQTTLPFRVSFQRASSSSP